MARITLETVTNKVDNVIGDVLDLKATKADNTASTVAMDGGFRVRIR